jgi:hypothetical protein
MEKHVVLALDENLRALVRRTRVQKSTLPSHTPCHRPGLGKM